MGIELGYQAYSRSTTCIYIYIYIIYDDDDDFRLYCHTVQVYIIQSLLYVIMKTVFYIIMVFVLAMHENSSRRIWSLNRDIPIHHNDAMVHVCCLSSAWLNRSRRPMLRQCFSC